MSTEKIITELIANGDPDFAQWSKPLLQVKENGYGENDNLLGIRTPILRKLAKKYSSLTTDEILELLHNQYHEIRSFALMVMINQYKNNLVDKQKTVNLYLDNADYINNWDLVDMSAPNILGCYIYQYKE